MDRVPRLPSCLANVDLSWKLLIFFLNELPRGAQRSANSFLHKQWTGRSKAMASECAHATQPPFGQGDRLLRTTKLYPLVSKRGLALFLRSVNRRNSDVPAISTRLHLHAMTLLASTNYRPPSSYVSGAALVGQSGGVRRTTVDANGDFG